jgi:hypothetical protein
MADLDKTDQAGAIAEPIFIDIGLGEVRCLDGTLIRFRKPRNDTHALSLTLPRVNSGTRGATSASTTIRARAKRNMAFRSHREPHSKAISSRLA